MKISNSKCCLIGLIVGLLVVIGQANETENQSSGNQVQARNSSHLQAASEQQQQQQQDGNGTLTLSEQLIKQTNLQAEESQETFAAIAPAPAHLQPQQQQQPQLQHQDGHSRPPVKFSGGSGNSYMSLSRDGSNRYQFGFDTHRATAAAAADHEPGRPSARPAARLMREESRLADGTVIGRYGYTDPFNVFRIVQYVAGADGYFASEDVGAVRDQDPNSPIVNFQLNRNLRRALERARSRRQLDLDHQATSSRQAVYQQNQRPTDETPSPPPSLPVKATLASNKPDQNEEETLSVSGSHQLTRYATRINHIIGNDGQSYATAFRPLINRNPSSQQYERVQRKREDTFGAIDSSLRSKLPAPIYAPNYQQQQQQQHQFALVIDHGNSNNHQAAKQVEPAAETVDFVRQSWPPINSDQYHQSRSHLAPPPPPPVDVIQSSPAWTLLDTNYGGQHQSTHLIIDHGSQPARSSNFQVGGHIEANFEHEAKLLKSLQRNGAGFATINKNNPTETTRAVATAAAATQLTAEHPSYNFGMALKQFNPPLYHPEVHETQPTIQSNNWLSQQQQPAVYASTIVHSEVAAEQSYSPERLTSRPARHFDLDILQKGASETSNKVVATLNEAPALIESAPANSNNRNDSSRELARLSRESTAAAAAAAAAAEHAKLLEPEKAEQVKPYATRLRPLNHRDGRAAAAAAANARLEPEDDLLMETSELVATTLAASNGTSRVRVPDRTKKLSSIFKSRVSSTQNSADDGSNSANGGSRIRRPIPSNVKKQFEQSRSSLKFAPDRSSLGSAAILQFNEPERRTHNANSSNAIIIIRESVEAPKQAVEIAAVQLNAEEVPSKVTQAPAAATTTTTTSTTTTTTTPEPISVMSTTETAPLSSEKPIAVVSGNQTKATETTMMIIDTTGHSNENDEMRSALDRSLYEKIVRIQQEIAAKSQATSTAAAAAAVAVEVPQQTTSAPPQAATVATTKLPTVQLAATTTTSTLMPETTTTTTTTVAPTTQAPAATSAASSTAAISVVAIGSEQVSSSPARVVAKVKTTNEEGIFLTGPLLAMDTPMERNDFLSKLNQDVDTFDSVRAQVLDSLPATSIQVQSQSNNGSIPTLNANNKTTEEEPQIINSNEKQARSVETVDRIAEQQQQQPNLSISNSKQTSLNVSISSNSSGNANNVEPLSQISEGSSTTTAAAATTTTVAPINTIKATTTKPIEVVDEVAPQKLKKSKPTSGQSANLPRFGRLVIKKGDKVVARFNASEPIPDSMIPIGSIGTGSDQLILPDMPRLGMRRPALKKRLNGTRTAIKSSNELQRINHLVASSQNKTQSDALPLPAFSNSSSTTTTAATAKTETPSSTGESTAAATAATTTTTAAPRLIAAELQAEPRVKSSRFARDRPALVRGSRSQRATLSSDEADLMVAESSENGGRIPANVDSNGESRASHSIGRRPDLANNTTAAIQLRLNPDAAAAAAARGANSRVMAAGGWSNRLRDTLRSKSTNSQATNKTYNPNEDLKKLVDKISLIESKPAAAATDDANQQQQQQLRANNKKLPVRRAKLVQSSPTRQSDDIPRRVIVSRESTTTISPQLIVPKSSNSTNEIMQPSSKPTTESSRFITEASVSTTTTTIKPNLEASLVANSSITTVGLNSSEDKAPVMIQTNQTFSLPKVNLSSIILAAAAAAAAASDGNRTTTIQSSQSSSASFTVAMSPSLEKNWEQLKPIDGQQLAKISDRIATSTAGNNNQTASGVTPKEVRVDSRGHIHVRNNQSVTVHVDIEPPARKSNQTLKLVEINLTKSNLDNNNSNNKTKRLISRDTTSQSEPDGRHWQFGPNDIRRLSGDAAAAGSRSAVLSSAAGGEKSAGSRAIEAESIINRRARMLCIEVEQDNAMQPRPALVGN